jgi:uncharacterized protein YecE (DUF72 family)
LPPQIRVGISGWTYAPWRGVFYPPKWPHAKELEYAGQRFNSIEINGSFYALQRPSSYQAWYAATPEEFVFTVKGGRFITHMRRLKNVESALANFYASGVLALREKLGPIFWQLPPNFQFNADTLTAFFNQLPRTTATAAELAAKHDAKIRAPAYTEVDIDRPLRYAMEVRHETFMCEAFVSLLQQHKIALVVADTAGKWPFMEDVTADFVYVRLHGDEQLYVSGYHDDALDRWATKVQAWSAGGNPADAKLVGPTISDGRPRDVFVYFDNDAKVCAPGDAQSLATKLGLL